MAKKVLFVDDEASWRELSSTALADAGYEVLTAADGSEAMLKGDDADLGLIVLDLNLAGESGLTLMKYLRHNHPGVPILLFTAMDHDDSTIRAMLEQGADQYLHKNTLAELIVTVGTYFRQLN
jgi:two-component system, OmpR family, alkaline phosphatase synthesis response regulator PhoP